jgi:hypothetical protein
VNCECQNWARDGHDSLKIGGKFLMPNHHPNCPHYNDSLMDVWKVTLNGCSCYVDNEPDADATAGMECDAAGGDTVSTIKMKMHREVFENLPEFCGF